MVMEENAYEEARKKRVLENLQKFEKLGISKVSKSLLDVVKSESKQLKSRSSERSKRKFEASELRRSSRARNPVTYCDQVDDIELRSYRKRSNDSGREYTGRYSTYEEQANAFQRAQDIQSSLDNPSFVKAMGLPSIFCKDYLPAKEARMVLEDEKGLEFDAVYIGSRSGLSGGWRGFAMHHGLEDGDALVFELTAPDRFKIYIVKALEDTFENENQKDTGTEDQAVLSREGEDEYEEKTPKTFRSADRSRKPRKSGSHTDTGIVKQSIVLAKEEREECEEKNTGVSTRSATRARKLGSRS